MRERERERVEARCEKADAESGSGHTSNEVWVESSKDNESAFHCHTSETQNVGLSFWRGRETAAATAVWASDARRPGGREREREKEKVSVQQQWSRLKKKLPIGQVAKHGWKWNSFLPSLPVLSLSAANYDYLRSQVIRLYILLELRLQIRWFPGL